jgi:hypothetical protein
MTVDVGEFPRVNLDQPYSVAVRGKEWRERHDRLRRLAEHVGEYAGIPMDIDGFSLVLEDRHPHKSTFERILSHPEPQSRTCTTDDVDDTVWIRNTWWCRQRNARVYLFQKGGKVEVLLDRRERTPARRITFAMMTLGAQQAWDLDCEYRARDKLKRMIGQYLYGMYELTGAFMWTSPRSGCTYIFRRLRPTVVMVSSDRKDETAPMRLLTALCLHPLGYYAETYAGSMVPTDDVIAHYLLATGDEHGFWRRANQHDIWTPEAGI